MDKRGQFYIIAAVIIIVVVLSLAAVTNYVRTKDKPKRFYNIGDILNMNGISIVQNAIYTKQSVNQVIEDYLQLFKNYLETNTEEDFNLVIIYGDQASGKITGKVFSRGSLGQVTFGIGDASFVASGGDEINVQNQTITVNNADNTVNVTVTEGDKTYVLGPFKLLDDQNNFIYVMTTSQGFNRYVQTNAPQI